MILALGALQFSRHFAPGTLDAAGMDWVQSARQLARTGKLSTEVVQPLLTARISVNGDGTAPDFYHAPLYSGLIASALRLTHQIGAGRGDREALLVNLLCYIVAAFVTCLLARRLFAGRSFSTRAAVIAALFFAFGGAALGAVVTVNPALLGALLFSLLLLALHGADASPADDAAMRPAAKTIPAGLAGYLLPAAAGALFGLLFLTIYSALLLLPAIAVHLYRIVRKKRQSVTEGAIAVALFLAAALLVSSPLLVRNQRLAHNPFYNAHLGDLICGTASYPNYGLRAQAVQPRSLSQYLSSGGVGEIGAKAGANVLGLIGASPVVLGLLVLRLFALAALTRFPDSRVGRLRTLVYICIASHLVGLAPYQSFTESVPVLLIYAPFASALSAGFLLTLIQARRMPAYYALAAQLGWTGLACVPGLARIAAPPPDPLRTAPYGVFAFLTESSPDMQQLRETDGYFVCDAPEEAAFRLDLPVVALPADASDMQTVVGRTGRPFGAILLTPALARRDPGDPATALWLQMYHDIIALSEVTARLDARLSRTVVKYTHLYYPAQLTAGMVGFRPAPFSERAGAEWSLLFWPGAVPNAASAAAGKPAGTPSDGVQNNRTGTGSPAAP